MQRTRYDQAVSNRALWTVNAVSVVIILAAIVAVSLAMGACSAQPAVPVKSAQLAHSAQPVQSAQPAPVKHLPAGPVCRLLYAESSAWSGEVSRCDRAWPHHPSQVALCALHYGPDAIGEDRGMPQADRRIDSHDCLSEVLDGTFAPNNTEIDPHSLYWTADGFTLGRDGCGINVRGIDGGPTCS